MDTRDQGERGGGALKKRKVVLSRRSVVRASRVQSWTADVEFGTGSARNEQGIRIQGPDVCTRMARMAGMINRAESWPEDETI